MFFFHTCLPVFSLVVSVFAFPVCELLIKVKRKKKKKFSRSPQKKGFLWAFTVRGIIIFFSFFGVLVTTFLYFAAVLFTQLFSVSGAQRLSLLLASYDQSF